MNGSTYTPQQLEKLHRTELDMLRAITKVCEDNGLQYFAIGGTSLGTVRHHGYIPWDDDMDIAMLRKDYDRFLELAPKQLPEKYVVQHFTTDPNTPTYFIKVRNKNTVFVEGYAKDLPIVHGIFVDIFCFDEVPESNFRFNVYTKVAFVLREIYLSNLLDVLSAPDLQRHKPVYKFTRKVTHAIFSHVPREKCFRWFDRHLRRYNGSGSTMLCKEGIPIFHISKDKLLPLKPLPFEDTVMPVPNDYDYALTHQYGDYMKLPPEEKRYCHKPYMLKFEDEQ